MKRARLHFRADLTILESHCDICICTGSGGHLSFPYFLSTLPFQEYRCPPPSEPVHRGVNALILSRFWVYQASRIPLVFVFLFFGLSLLSCDTRLWAHGTYLFSGSVFVNNPTLFTFLLCFLFLFWVSISFLLWRLDGAWNMMPDTWASRGYVCKAGIYRNCITCYELKQPSSRWQVPSLSACMMVVWLTE